MLLFIGSLLTESLPLPTEECQGQNQKRKSCARWSVLLGLIAASLPLPPVTRERHFAHYTLRGHE